MSTLTVVRSASAYVLGVLLDGLVLLTRLTTEALACIRVVYLRRAIQRQPQQRTEHEPVITRLHEARARRWEPWRELPATRRFVVSAAALMTVGILAWTIGRDGSSVPPTPWEGFPELQSGLVAANPSVARMKDGVWLWFVARSAQGVEEIRVAYRSGAL